jgi:serine/threonine protein kinase
MSRPDDRERANAPNARVGDAARELTGRFGEFELMDLAGRDGPFAYYRARQVSLDRPVMLKVLVEGSQSIERAGLLRREAETANRLDHPDIVPVFEVGIHEGTPFLVMAGIEGEPLSERLNFGPLPSRLAAELVRQLADTLAHAHDKGVIHGSLRPGAVWVTAGQQIRLCGFGQIIHYDTADLGALTSFVGYLAPEQAGARGVVGKNTDVYGLGAILFAMLTGRPPHRAATVKQTFSAIRQRITVEPSRIVRTVGEDLDVICGKCLDPAPARRYGMERPLTRLNSDLSRYLSGKSIKSDDPDLGRRLWTFARRHQRALLGLGLVFLALVLPALWDRLRHRSAWRVLANANASVAEYEQAESYFERRRVDRPDDPESSLGLALARLRCGHVEDAARLIPAYSLQAPRANDPNRLELVWHGAHDDWTITTKLVRVRIGLEQGRWAQANTALTGVNKIAPRRPIDWRLYEECNRVLREDRMLVAAVRFGDPDAAKYAAEHSPSAAMLHMLEEKLASAQEGRARLAAAWLLTRFGRAATPALPALICQIADSTPIDLKPGPDDAFSAWLGVRSRILFRTAVIKALDAVDPDWTKSPQAKASVANLTDAIAAQSSLQDGVEGLMELVTVLDRIDADWMSSNAAEAHRRDWEAWPRRGELPDLGQRILQRLDARKKRE